MRATRRDVLRFGAAGAAWVATGCRRPMAGAGAVAVAGAGAPAITAEPLPAWTIPGGLRRPGGLAFTSDGGLMLAESGRHRLRRFGPDGALVATYGRCGMALGEWNDPAAIVCQDTPGVEPPRDAWFVADRGNGRVVTVRADGAADGAVGTLGIDDGEFLGPTGLALGPLDRLGPPRPMLIVADSRNRRVKVCDAYGVPRAFLWDGNVADVPIRRPDDVAVFGRQLVAVADSLRGVICAFQLVVSDVRMAFAEPGMAEIPAAGRLRGLWLGGLAGPIRLATMPLNEVRSDVVESPERFGEQLLVAHGGGVVVCGTRLEVLGHIPGPVLGVRGPIVAGGVACSDRAYIVAVSDAATGSILRARIRFA